MRRRDAVALLGVTALGGAALGAAMAAWRLAVPPPQKLPVIGYLSSASIGGPVPTAFRMGLNQKGFVPYYAEFPKDAPFRETSGALRGDPVTLDPGQNVIIETRQAEGHYEKLPALAAEFVSRPVNVIVAAGGLVSARAAMAATKTIPVLFIAGFDPVKLGLVSSFNRPGGNATGISIYTTELLAKRLELLRELMPRMSRIALLVNADNVVSEIEVEDMARVAGAAGLALIPVKASAAIGLEAAFATAVAERADALLVSADPFLTIKRKSIAALATRHALPAAYPWREYVESGGLMSYGPSLMDAYYQIGIYAGRLLKGEKPGDLPVQLPLKFDLGVNLKTAKALNLTVPRVTLLAADPVIE
jgi:putative ABC transport system substrate-binding protein